MIARIAKEEATINHPLPGLKRVRFVTDQERKIKYHESD